MQFTRELSASQGFWACFLPSVLPRRGEPSPRVRAPAGKARARAPAPLPAVDAPLLPLIHRRSGSVRFLGFLLFLFCFIFLLELCSVGKEIKCKRQAFIERFLKNKTIEKEAGVCPTSP